MTAARFCGRHIQRVSVWTTSWELGAQIPAPSDLTKVTLPSSCPGSLAYRMIGRFRVERLGNRSRPGFGYDDIRGAHEIGKIAVKP